MKAKYFVTALVAASVGLSGCVVSDNPAVNTVATVGAIGAAALLYYSMNDGYYYDSHYNRMPRDYRPARNVRIERIDNMDHYRRAHQRMDNRNDAWRNQNNGRFSQPPHMQQRDPQRMPPPHNGIFRNNERY